MVYLVGISIAWLLHAREQAQVSATPPEASSEYSRAPATSQALLGVGARVPGAVLGGGALGALLLVAAEFLTLFDVHTSASPTPVKSVLTGAHNAYAMIPIALFAVALAYGARRHGSRPALLALAAVGVVALLIALLGDLPDAHASGIVATPSGGGQYATASSRPAVGLYLETLGAVLLLLAAVIGFLLGGPAPPRESAAPGRISDHSAG